ncbi:MAG TPA: hypothetical protein VGQ39_19940 [Pyrinomonadaceae bacterium]|jgi:hypothetical protein|nr:hypothetical protein [Pyrinomonadaceae bacterium]
MKFIIHLYAALLTFVIGVTVTALWSTCNPSKSKSVSAPVASPPTRLVQTAVVFSGDNEDSWKYEKGLYSNDEYGYSLRIPDPFIAYRSPEPMPNHGFAIDLSKRDDATVWVDGMYNALEWASLNQAARANLEYLHDPEVTDIRMVQCKYIRLSRLRAVRIVAAYKRTGISMIEDEIIAIRKERDIVYTLKLRTTVARYSEDVKVLDRLHRTFNLEPVPY